MCWSERHDDRRRPFFKLAHAALGALAALSMGACTGNVLGERHGGARPTPTTNTGGGDSVGVQGSSHDFAAGPLAMTRLTERAYLSTLRDLFGEAVLVHVSTEPDFVIDGSTAIGARAVSVSRSSVRLYANAAESVAQTVMADPSIRSKYFSCVPSAVDDSSCAEAVVSGLGQRIFRRPLDATETQRFSTLLKQEASTAKDFWTGAQYALAAMLLSPKFTHLIEVGAPAADGSFAYTDYELGSRLSYLLWNTTPDETLLTAAAAGKLSTEQGLAEQADRLLGDAARLSEGVRALSLDAFSLARVDSITKDPARYVDDSPALRASMKEAALLMIADVLVTGARSYDSLFEANEAFVDQNLAPFYGVAAPTAGFVRIDLPVAGLRTGLLTEPGLLTMLAGAQVTSPTKRGRFIRERLLCGHVPDPPPNVDMSIPVTAAGDTRRAQATDHMHTPACNACHSAMDPLGFGLENFDALGHLQATDNGHPIDASGSLDGVAFTNARELSHAIRTSPQLTRCTMTNLLRHVAGRLEAADDEAALQDAVAYYQQVGGVIRPLLRRFVMSTVFRKATAAP